MFTGEKQYLERESDDLWARMEELFYQRQTASPECWADMDVEYSELDRRYHATLERLYAVNNVNRDNYERTRR